VAGKEKGTVTVDSFLAVYKAQPESMLIIDVREPREFVNGAIKGSTNLPINQLEKNLASLPANKPVVFVCGTGARSGEAYDMVKLMRGEVNALFIDADAKFNADGTFTMTPKK
jgi:rhodanese-related sulfurtransferase